MFPDLSIGGINYVFLLEDLPFKVSSALGISDFPISVVLVTLCQLNTISHLERESPSRYFLHQTGL